MKSTIRIRAVDGANKLVAEQLRQLQLETLPNDVLVDTSEGFWWIAFDGKTPVAFLGLVPSRLYTNWGYITRVGVIYRARGQRLQYRLSKVAERHARRMGLEGLESNTYENPPSSNNFIRLGYVTYEPSHRDFCDGTTYWTRPLK